MKFKFDYLNGRLWRVEEEYNYELPEDQKFTGHFGEIGFLLDPDYPAHHISFALYPREIRVFHKQVQPRLKQIIYYQKELFLPPSSVLEFELTAADIVAKKEGELAWEAQPTNSC